MMKKSAIFLLSVSLISGGTLFSQDPRTISRINSFIEEYRTAHQFRNIEEANIFVNLFENPNVIVSNDINDNQAKRLPVKEYVKWILNNLCAKEILFIIRIDEPSVLPKKTAGGIENFEVQVAKAIDYPNWYKYNDLVITLKQVDGRFLIQEIKTYKEYTRREGRVKLFPASFELSFNSTLQGLNNNSSSIKSNPAWFNAQLLYPIMKVRVNKFLLEPIIGGSVAYSHLEYSIANNAEIEIPGQNDEKDTFTESLTFKQIENKEIVLRQVQNSLNGLAGLKLSYFVRDNILVFLNSNFCFELLPFKGNGTFVGSVVSAGHYQMDEDGPWKDGFEYEIKELPAYGFDTYGDLDVDGNRKIRNTAFSNVEIGLSYALNDKIIISAGLGAHFGYQTDIPAYDRNRRITGRFIDLSSIIETPGVIINQTPVDSDFKNSLHWLYPSVRILLNF